MARKVEQWMHISGPVKLEAPRKTYRFDGLFISPGGLFVASAEAIDPGTAVSVHFGLGDQAVVAHAEIRRLLAASAVRERGIDHPGAGWELRLVRMEGNGASQLAEHIKKILLSSGGPS